MFQPELSEECKAEKSSLLPAAGGRQAEPRPPSLHVSSPASRKTFPTPAARGIPSAAPGLGSIPGAAVQGAPPRGRPAPETRRQQPAELAGSARGSLQRPRKSPRWVAFRPGGPWDYQASGRQPAADWEVARFSTSELEKAAPGIILGTVRHENLQKQIRQAMRSKTMYFEMNQAGETPRSSPQPRNGAFFPHEANLSIAWKRGKPLQLPSRLPIPASLPTRAEHPSRPLGHVTERGSSPAGREGGQMLRPACQSVDKPREDPGARFRSQAAPSRLTPCLLLTV